MHAPVITVVGHEINERYYVSSVPSTQTPTAIELARERKGPPVPAKFERRSDYKTRVAVSRIWWQWKRGQLDLGKAATELNALGLTCERAIFVLAKNAKERPTP